MIVDAMLLVAASAVVFDALCPLVTGRLQEHPAWAGYLAVAIGLPVTWMPTALILRFRRPRPVFRRLARQPGFAASLVGTAILSICA